MAGMVAQGRRGQSSRVSGSGTTNPEFKLSDVDRTPPAQLEHSAKQPNARDQQRREKRSPEDPSRLGGGVRFAKGVIQRHQPEGYAPAGGG